MINVYVPPRFGDQQVVLVSEMERGQALWLTHEQARDFIAQIEQAIAQTKWGPVASLKSHENPGTYQRVPGPSKNPTR